MHDLQELGQKARDAAGNHRSFEAFGWLDRPDDDEKWYIHYYQNRDSDVLERSNAESLEGLFNCAEDKGVILPEDWCFERHNHWAVGWVDALVIRVFGDTYTENPSTKTVFVTSAFELLFATMKRLEDYPVLNEDRYYELEHEEFRDTLVNCFGVEEHELARVCSEYEGDWCSDYMTQDDVDHTLHTSGVRKIGFMLACVELYGWPAVKADMLWERCKDATGEYPHLLVEDVDSDYEFPDLDDIDPDSPFDALVEEIDEMHISPLTRALPFD